MAITKFDSYYKQIKDTLESIKEEFGYNNLSQAFIHWYLKNYFNFTDQQIEESLIDGSGDNGVDVITLNEESKELTVMQFKFPNKIENINSEISQADILKTLHGFKLLIKPSDEKIKNNDKFNDYKEQLKDTDIFRFNIFFVSFNKGIISNRDDIENFAADFKRDHGSDMYIYYHDRLTISNIYERINRQNSLEINLRYKQMTSAYDIYERSVKSFVGLVNGKELINAIEDNIETIFDENIRLYEGRTNVNNMIKKTASNQNEGSMFYFYNNGITFICDEANNSPNKLSINLKGVSIVNGCQTATSLYELQEKNKLQENVDILVRVMEISDYTERMKITEYLNSQNPIKDSYFIANHTIIRDLQNELLKKGYYLERQINEIEYKKRYDDSFDSSIKPITLEKAIQNYTGYWINKYAAIAKRGKSALFDKNKIDEILMEIDSDKVIESEIIYCDISKVLTKYRKTRRNNNKNDFAEFLGISQNQLLKDMTDYLFVNTGDILILNAVSNLKKQYKKLRINFNNDKLIKHAIFIIRDIIKAEGQDDIRNISSITKNNATFKKVQEFIYDMNSEYNI